LFPEQPRSPAKPFPFGEIEQEAKKSTTSTYWGESSKSTDQQPAPKTISETSESNKNKSQQKSDQQPAPKTFSETSESNKNKSQQKSKPPPIVIDTGGGAEIRMLANKINNQPGSILVNVKKDGKKSKFVTTESWEDHKKLIQLLKEKQHHFHTYSSQEPLMKFVLYGLPDMEISDLEKELQMEKVAPVKIVKMTMKNKRHEKDDDQNYLLYFKKEEAQGGNFLEFLKKIKNVNGFKVNWAYYKNRQTGPAQCSKCLQFGHGQLDCEKPSICFRCSEQHDSKTCQYISKETNKVPLEKLKCHFCGEKHTAISPVCKIRQQIIEKWKSKSKNGNNRNQYKPAGQQKQSGQWRNTPPTTHRAEKSNKPQQQASQKQPSNDSAPSTSGRQQTVCQKTAPVKNKTQTNIPPPSNNPLNQGNSTNNTERGKNWAKQQKKRKNKKTNKNKNKSNSQSLKSKQAAEPMDSEDVSHPTQTTNEVDSESTFSGNVVIQNSQSVQQTQGTSKDDENITELVESKCKSLISELLEFIAKNPEFLEKILQAIGSTAKNTTNNNGF